MYFRLCPPPPLPRRGPSPPPHVPTGLKGCGGAWRGAARQGRAESSFEPGSPAVRHDPANLVYGFGDPPTASSAPPRPARRRRTPRPGHQATPPPRPHPPHPSLPRSSVCPPQGAVNCTFTDVCNGAALLVKDLRREPLAYGCGKKNEGVSLHATKIARS